MRRDYTLFIKDILAYMEDAESFVKNMSFEEFVDDKKSVTYCISDALQKIEKIKLY
ncbi:MAG: hypothetical protein ACE5J9_05105 [Methanosarcinales archaeon]